MVDTASPLFTNPPAPVESQSVDSLSIYQGEYRGLVIGADTPYHLEGPIEGLLGSVMRVGDRAVPRGHGYIQGPDYAEERTVFFPFVVIERPHSPLLRSLLSNLWTAFVPTPEEEHWLRWNLLGETRAWRGRVVRNQFEYGPENARTGVFRSFVEFIAADPFIYSDEEYSVIVAEQTVLDRGGFDLPADLPLDLGLRIVSQSNIHTDGNTTTWPVIRFQNNGSTASFVQLVNRTTGVTLRVNSTIPTGDTLVVDMYGYQRSSAGPHISIDGASRFGDWQHPRTPWGLAPGDNVVEFTTDGDDVVCRVTWRDAWL